ncbi:helix-turn-helix transcriptional regulator [Clostridioides sp. ES-S-0190-01]|uniref:helix-turn-helix transcriptional regulator n=1 Tax=Clostridioides sp. ES-S-0190-01 TaxID=2770787 RepID=UPI001D117137|nr:YafY family transcriptional regulator [Clostridioides sp. ES-S-0190-01]
MKSNRLFEIIYILLDKKRVTATELAEHFEVSRRTICRDIEILSSSGIPIYTDKGRNGGIGILDNFTFDKSILSEQEQKEILASLEGLNMLKYPDMNSTLAKLRALFCKSDLSWITVDFSHWCSNNVEKDKFIKIKSAILDCNIITFEYISTYGKITKRCVEPLMLWFKEKSWYIKAYCRQKNDYRIFKVVRMKNICICEQTFIRSIPIEVGEIKEDNNKNIILKLKISKDIAYRVYDEFDIDNILYDNDGNFIVNVQYPQNDWIYGYVLSFGNHIEVLEPIDVRDKILQIVDDIKIKYL